MSGGHGRPAEVLSPRRAFYQACWRVYTSQFARASHLLSPGDSPNSSWATAVCGERPPGTWWGTGSQQEYDAAKALPLCKRCQAKSGLS